MSPGSASNLGNPLCGVPLGYGDLAQRFKFAVPLRGIGVVLDGSVCLRVWKGNYPSLPSRRRPQDRRTLPRNCTGRPFFDFFRFFRMQKNVEKTDGQKIDIFRQFWRFLGFRRRFSAIFGLKTGPRRLLFRCFSENGDFLKIVLPRRK